ncbi:MAG: hypothetical protein JXJ17_10730 [Anaerolineae bacterium]|nr:hypothetical protein [Anaerolineae bacterium]
MKQRKSIRVTVRLDLEYDADLIDWLRDIPDGSRSAMIRAVWRRGLREQTQAAQVDVESLRSIISHELHRVLGGQGIEQVVDDPVEADNSDIEEQYGDRLDRMLGGLSAGSDGEMLD